MDKIQELHNKHGYRNDNLTRAELSLAEEIVYFNWFLKKTGLNITKSSFFEIATGSGNFYDYLVKNRAKDYIGSEIGKNQINQFKKLFPDQAHRLKEGDALSILKSPGGSKFDCVIAFNVLEHLNNDYFIELFATTVERLKPGGEFWIKVPCAESIIANYVLYGDLTHQRLFTLINFKVLAEIYHLDIVSYAGKMVAPVNLKGWLRYTHNKLLYLLNRFLYAFEIGVRKNLGVFSTDLVLILKKE